MIKYSKFIASTATEYQMVISVLSARLDVNLTPLLFCRTHYQRSLMGP
jgi:hypothetical protein